MDKISQNIVWPNSTLISHNHELINCTSASVRPEATNFTIPFYVHYAFGLKLWLTFILFFGWCGGLTSYLLATTILTKRHLRSGSGFLIAHALFTEGTFCFFAFPLLAFQTYLAQYQPPSHTFCKLSTLFYYLLKQSLHWSELLVALNRFIGVTFPLKYKAVTSARVTASLIIYVWFQSLICELIPLLELGAVMDAQNIWKMCIQRGKGNPTGFLVLLTINSYIPITAEGLLYLTMFFVFFLKNSIHKTVAPATHEKNPVRSQVTSISTDVEKTKRRLRVAKMLFFGYILTATSSLMTPIIAAVYPRYLVYPLLFLLLRAVLLFGYALHPVIFLLLSKEYRVAMARVLRTTVLRGSKLMTDRHNQADKTTHQLSMQPAINLRHRRGLSFVTSYKESSN